MRAKRNKQLKKIYGLQFTKNTLNLHLSSMFSP